MEDRVRVGRTLVAGFAVSTGIVVAFAHGSVRAQGRSSPTVVATDATALAITSKEAK
jgi:ABC-type transporter Mla subunit MlaD